MESILNNDKIYVAGHKGMVGSAIKKCLEINGYTNLVYKSSNQLDLRDQKKTVEFISNEKPKVVIIAAARVGGILANDTYPYNFIYENLQIQNNLINASLLSDVDKVIFLGSSCIYPKLADQPIKESSLLTGSLESSNEWYAIAKIAGIKLIEAAIKQFGKDFVSLMPTNLYGPRDNFDLKTSHVLPALIRKFHEAKENGNSPVTLWGSGNPKREFLYVDDLAKAVLLCLERKLSNALYNVGTGRDISIKELSILIQKIVGHKGQIIWDKNKPDGTPRKLLDVSKLNDLGWSYTEELDSGIEKTYNWFLKNQNSIREIKLGNPN